MKSIKNIVIIGSLAIALLGSSLTLAQDGWKSVGFGCAVPNTYFYASFKVQYHESAPNRGITTLAMDGTHTYSSKCALTWSKDNPIFPLQTIDCPGSSSLNFSIDAKDSLYQATLTRSFSNFLGDENKGFTETIPLLDCGASIDF